MYFKYTLDKYIEEKKDSYIMGQYGKRPNAKEKKVNTWYTKAAHSQRCTGTNSKSHGPMSVFYKICKSKNKRITQIPHYFHKLSPLK